MEEASLGVKLPPGVRNDDLLCQRLMCSCIILILSGVRPFRGLAVTGLSGGRELRERWPQGQCSVERNPDSEIHKRALVGI